jgi:hypothetical protein
MSRRHLRRAVGRGPPLLPVVYSCIVRSLCPGPALGDGQAVSAGPDDFWTWSPTKTQGPLETSKKKLNMYI